MLHKSTIEVTLSGTFCHLDLWILKHWCEKVRWCEKGEETGLFGLFV